MLFSRYRRKPYSLASRTIKLDMPKDVEWFSNLSDNHAAMRVVGTMWPGGVVLAELMDKEANPSLSYLEIGVGLGLPTLTLLAHECQVTSLDVHPQLGPLLERNAKLNRTRHPHFVQANWSSEDTRLGSSDVVMGSDVLYEPSHIATLPAFLNAHTHPGSQVIFVEPDRGLSSEMFNNMASTGYEVERTPARLNDFVGSVYRLKRTE